MQRKRNMQLEGKKLKRKGIKIIDEGEAIRRRMKTIERGKEGEEEERRQEKDGKREMSRKQRRREFVPLCGVGVPSSPAL